jgi:hypothetical protein
MEDVVPCSISATGLPRLWMAARKSFMWARIAEATCCSRSFSLTSSGYLVVLDQCFAAEGRLCFSLGDESVFVDVGFEHALVPVNKCGPWIFRVRRGTPRAVCPYRV